MACSTTPSSELQGQDLSATSAAGFAEALQTTAWARSQSERAQPCLRLQETSAEALQAIAGITLAVLADKKTAVPDALLQTAVLLHDTALLVSLIFLSLP